MRTTIATHALLPKGLYLENLSIETGRVSISVVLGTRRLHREAQGGGQAEALQGPDRAPAAKALRPR